MIGQNASGEEDNMNGRSKSGPFQILLLAVISVLLFMSVGCGGKTTAQQTVAEPEPRVITARFTTPVSLEPQPSDKCIACHTKTNPITKLGSVTEAAAEAGG